MRSPTDDEEVMIILSVPLLMRRGNLATAASLHFHYRSLREVKHQRKVVWRRFTEGLRRRLRDEQTVVITETNFSRDGREPSDVLVWWSAGSSGMSPTFTSGRWRLTTSSPLRRLVSWVCPRQTEVTELSSRFRAIWTSAMMSYVRVLTSRSVQTQKRRGERSICSPFWKWRLMLIPA